MFCSKLPALRGRYRYTKDLLCPTEGSAILEFALTLPLLVVFVVGIYDFAGAFNQKQKVEQAAQEGAIVAAAQPTSDMYYPPNPNPDSLQPVVAAVFNSLAGSGVLPQAGSAGNCKLPPPIPLQQPGLVWVYTITGCPDDLTIKINRGWAFPNILPGATDAIGTQVTVTYPYHWRFNSVIQLLIPGAQYAVVTNVTESATVHNQM